MKMSPLYYWYFAYFGLLTLLRFRFDIDSLWFVLGGLMGLGFVFVDRFIYVFVTKPHAHLSEHVKHLLRSGRYKDAVLLLKARGDEQTELTVRSIFFMGAWIPVALFITSSTGSMLASGFVMGIGLHLLHDIVRDWQQPDRLRRLMWPMQHSIGIKELKIVAILFGVFFGLISLVLI
jgi:hypothetical protein